MGPSRSCWNGTSALQPEEVTSKGTRVSCVYYHSYLNGGTSTIRNCLESRMSFVDQLA